MLVIRYQRWGRKKRPFYQVVVCNQKARRDGGVIKYLGTYDPILKIINLKVNDTLSYLKHGAKTTLVVNHLLAKLKIFEKIKSEVL